MTTGKLVKWGGVKNMELVNIGIVFIVFEVAKWNGGNTRSIGPLERRWWSRGVLEKIWNTRCAGPLQMCGKVQQNMEYLRASNHKKFYCHLLSM